MPATGVPVGDDVAAPARSRSRDIHDDGGDIEDHVIGRVVAARSCVQPGGELEAIGDHDQLCHHGQTARMEGLPAVTEYFWKSRTLISRKQVWPATEGRWRATRCRQRSPITIAGFALEVEIDGSAPGAAMFLPPCGTRVIIPSQEKNAGQ